GLGLGLLRGGLLLRLGLNLRVGASLGLIARLAGAGLAVLLLRGPIRVPVARAAATAPRPAARGLLFVAGLGRCLRGSVLPVSNLCVDSLRLGGLRLSSLVRLRGLFVALLERRLRDGRNGGARLVLLLLSLR